MTESEFYSTIWTKVGECPKNWRLGQKVFNVTSEVLLPLCNGRNVATDVQFRYDGNLDCFYDDTLVDKFLAECWNRLDAIQRETEMIQGWIDKGYVVYGSWGSGCSYAESANKGESAADFMKRMEHNNIDNFTVNYWHS